MEMARRRYPDSPGSSRSDSGVENSRRGRRRSRRPFHAKSPPEPLRRRRLFSTPESASDDPGLSGHLRRAISTIREPPGRSNSSCERGVNDSVHTSHRSHLGRLYSHHVHSGVPTDQPAGSSCRTCNGDILSARDSPEPTLGSMYIVSQEYWYVPQVSIIRKLNSVLPRHQKRFWRVVPTS